MASAAVGHLRLHRGTLHHRLSWACGEKAEPPIRPKSDRGCQLPPECAYGVRASVPVGWRCTGSPHRTSVGPPCSSLEPLSYASGGSTVEEGFSTRNARGRDARHRRTVRCVPPSARPGGSPWVLQVHGASGLGGGCAFIGWDVKASASHHRCSGSSAEQQRVSPISRRRSCVVCLG